MDIQGAQLDSWDRAALKHRVIRSVVTLPKEDQRFLAHVISAIAENLPEGAELSLNDLDRWMTEARLARQSVPPAPSE